MYAIRYRKVNTGTEYVRMMSSWEEAIDVWSRLMAEPAVRMLPSQDTGLDIEWLNYGRNDADSPPAFRMLSAC